METKKRVMIFCMILRPINDNINNTPYHRDAESTERILCFARSGDGDRAKKLSLSGGLCKGITTSVAFMGNRSVVKELQTNQPFDNSTT
jgi:hypothetical protein